MYAAYAYAAGSMAQNIVNDLALLLTGTTDKTLLSANCVQANTAIFTDYDAAGWTMHDNAAATASVVLKAPVADNASQFKYAQLDAGSQAGYLGLTAYEGWNASTHAGTNMADYARFNGQKPSYWERLNLTSGGVVYVSASVKRIVLLTFQSSLWGAANAPWMGIFERPRDMWYDTSDAGYVPVVWEHAYGLMQSSGAVGQAPRLKNLTTNADGISVSMSATIPCNLVSTPVSSSNMSNSRIYNPSGVLSYLILPLIASSVGPYAYYGSNLSSMSDIWVLQPGYGANLDEIVFNGKTYVVWNNTTTNTSGSLLVPKG